MDDITKKNDLYNFLGDELVDEDRGRSRGTLKRVRAGYDFAEFEVPSGKEVNRDVDEIFDAIEQGYEFK